MSAYGPFVILTVSQCQVGIYLVPVPFSDQSYFLSLGPPERNVGVLCSDAYFGAGLGIVSG